MKAQESAPCILLIDEIDVIAQKRDSTHREMEKRIVSQLIICLDDLNKTSDQKTSPTFELNFASNGDVGLEDTSLNRNRSKHVLSYRSVYSKCIFDCLFSGIRLDESVQMHNLARLTPGYVGADLKALAREASMCAVNRVFETVARSSQRPGRLNIEETNEELTKLLEWLKSEQTLDDSKITNLFVQLDDFKKALTIVHPSAKREGFVTVPDVSWQDIGALNEVREELKWSIL
ncbi:unnamed protein product, partial [Anisakis simplex]|uniref:ATPase_AAA_core domain-containing protein n=1 Tax=Anisakis simplex TaxID=6269 RepID=A0A0M3KG27_ANISI